MDTTHKLSFTMSPKGLDSVQTLQALDFAKNTIRELLDFIGSAPNGFVLSIEFRVNPNMAS